VVVVQMTSWIHPLRRHRSVERDPVKVHIA